MWTGENGELGLDIAMGWRSQICPDTTIKRRDGWIPELISQKNEIQDYVVQEMEIKGIPKRNGSIISMSLPLENMPDKDWNSRKRMTADSHF